MILKESNVNVLDIGSFALNYFRNNVFRVQKLRSGKLFNLH